MEPLRLVHVGALWYLVAWDRSKQQWRTFRLDRIVRLAVEAEHLKARPPQGGNLVEFVTTSVASSPYPLSAKVLLHAPLEKVRPRLGPRDGLLQPVSKTRCTLELGAATMDVLASRILWLGVDFEVGTLVGLRPPRGCRSPTDAREPTGTASGSKAWTCAGMMGWQRRP